MERLILEEIIDHYKRKTELIEKYPLQVYFETAPIESNVVREYWEYKQVAEYLQELLVYRSLEEQGKLLKLPCKINDTVWVVTSPINVFGFNDNVFGFTHRDEDAEYEVYESFISSVSYYAQGEQFRIYAKVTNNFIAAYFRECDFGKTIFLTYEEAEAKLKEIHERKVKNE